MGEIAFVQRLEFYQCQTHKVFEMVDRNAHSNRLVFYYLDGRYQAVFNDNLLSDPAASGRLRTTGVGIAGSVYIPLEAGTVIQECSSRSSLRPGR
jgi:hypothetical protein